MTVEQQRIFEWEHLNNRQLARLDRLETVVLLPLGNTQQFGPHLPHGTTSFAVRDITQEAARLLTMTERQRRVVILPLLPYGADPVELRHGDRFTRASSLSIRPHILTSLIADIAEGVVRNGFRYLFTIGYTNGEAYSRAVRQALEGASHKYPALIAEDLFSYLAAGVAENAAPDLRTLVQRRVSPMEQAAMETPGHGGMAHTAIMLALDANLVDPDYVAMEGLAEDNITAQEDWQGYYGSPPSLAEADLGQALLTQQAYRATYLIRKALAGESLAELPRVPVF